MSAPPEEYARKVRAILRVAPLPKDARAPILMMYAADRHDASSLGR
jgi:hypothetical protein